MHVNEGYARILKSEDISNILYSMANVPRWPELAHFNSILRLDFSDGAKWNDVSKVFKFKFKFISVSSQVYHFECKVIVPVVFRAVPKATTKKGFALLKLIRKYIELNAYLSLGVQTEDTLDAFELTLADFEACLVVCDFYFCPTFTLLRGLE